MPNTNDGWIKAWRKIAVNEIWLEKPFSKGQAWMDLLMLATRKTHKSVRNGETIQYKAGYVYESVTRLSDRWGWNRMKVYRFYRQLKEAKMIDYESVTPKCASKRTLNVTPLRIVNWDVYQGDVTDNVTQKRTQKCTYPKNDIYPENEYTGEKNEYGADEMPLPGSIEMIRPEIDLVGCPPFEQMPTEGDKRMIPKRVVHLFEGDYDAFWRYMKRCHTK